jgi:hypothetical protein
VSLCAINPSFATRSRERRFAVAEPLIRQCFCGQRFENGVR